MGGSASRSSGRRHGERGEAAHGGGAAAPNGAGLFTVAGPGRAFSPMYIEGLYYNQQQAYRPPPPPPLQHTQTIHNNVNLKKNTLRCVRSQENPNIYTVEFTFDAATDCHVTVFFAGVEVGGANDAPDTIQSFYKGAPARKHSYYKGLGQKFVQPVAEGLDTTKLNSQQDMYFTQVLPHEQQQYPVLILLETQVSGEATSSAVQSQTSFATFAPSPEGGDLVLKVIKQKIQVGGRAYELQEIYGIENCGDDTDNSKECVICMSAPRDTTVLPCRHMCMCSECAKVLRTQTNKCPICRTAVGSLLQIKISRKEPPPAASVPVGAAAPATSAIFGGAGGGDQKFM